MAHDVRAKDITAAITAADDVALDVRITAGPLTGGFTLRGGDKAAAYADALRYLDLEFHAQNPVVTDINAIPAQAAGPHGFAAASADVDPRTIDQLAAAVADAPKATPLPADRLVTVPAAPAMDEAATTRNAQAASPALTANDIPDHFPSNWNAQAVDALDGKRRNTMNWFRWDSKTGASPSKVPNDWGIEIGITLFDDLIGGGTRSQIPGVSCRGSHRDPTTAFWAQTWEAPDYIWVSTLPEAAAAYPDTWLLSDPCAANSLELGIGYPRMLKADTVYFLQSATLKGNQPEGRSAMSAGAYLKGNDCRGGRNPERPSTTCMGLDTTRKAPATDRQSYVNKNRNWTAPGCYAMVTGWAAPTHQAPGAGGCPTKR